MDSFDINLDNLEPISLKIDDYDSAPSSSSKSVNFGGGIELLMNNSKRSAGNATNIDLGDIGSLENELNELSSGSGGNNGSSNNGSNNGSETKVLSGISNFFGFGSDKGTGSSGPGPSVPSDSGLGQATKETGAGTNKTWDGFMKFNDIPDRPVQSRMTDREKLRKKRLMMKRLDEWREKGLVGNHVHFNNDSSYEEVEDEYETALEDKKKKESTKLYSWWFMTAVNTIEYANSAFNPFDVNLDGWGEQVSDDIDSYDEIFGELYEKYKGGKLSPEIALMLRLGFSAAVVNFTNRALSSATPGFNDVIRQSPELMKAFTNATVSSMSQQSPGFAFANNLVNPEPTGRQGPPPAAVDPRAQTKRPGMVFTEQQPANSGINAVRGSMFKEAGVELNNNSFDSASRRPPLAPQPQQRQEMSGLRPEMSGLRPEMSGPKNTNLDSILSGLKTKTVDIHENRDDDSVVSVTSLNGSRIPSGRRRKGSDKNIVSLDI
jgi:hypothetical protein